jgi:hydroxypyruvate isomerase
VPSLEDAVAIVRALDHPAVRLQFDQYHVGMVGLDPIEEYRRFRDLVAYVQVADIDGRHEPAPGSRAVPDFVDALVQDGYDGVIGLEYDPRADTPASLTWLDPWREPRETAR